MCVCISLSPSLFLTDVVGRRVEQQAGDLEVVVRQRSEDGGVLPFSPEHLVEVAHRHKRRARDLAPGCSVRAWVRSWGFAF